MAEAGRIADLLRRAYEGDAWHGPCVTAVLKGVGAEQAAARPLAGAHSIWEIVQHMRVWDDVVRRRLEGDWIGDLPPEQDWPAVGATTPSAWSSCLTELEQAHRRLRETIAGVDDRRLGDAVPERDYNVYVMMHGIVQHDLYHAGQISLLKRALAGAG